MADQRKFLDFLDMIDGGGAGAMGDKFEGGGIFSMLANALATPYGSEDEERKAARMKAHGLLNDVKPTAGAMSISAPEINSVMRPKARPADLNIPLDAFGGAGPNITGAAAERGMGLDPFGGAGPNITGAAAERNVGLDAFGGYGPEYTAPSYANMPYGEMGRMGGVGQDMYNIGQGGEFGPSGLNPEPPQSMVDQNMMIGVLERAGLDRASLEQLGYGNIENLYNQHLNALRSRRRGM